MDINTNLLMQYLSGVGAAMSQGESPAAALNQITQQQMGAESKAKLIKAFSDMLRGNYPEGAKWSTDAKSDTLVIPRSLMTEGGEVEAGTGRVSEPTPLEGVSEFARNITSGQTPTAGQAQGLTQNNVRNNRRLGAANPFAMGQLGEIDPSDLVGLTSQDVSQALGDATGVTNMQRQSINDVTDRMYKQALTDQARAQIAAMGMPKDERTAAMKNYEYAVNQGYTGSFDEWQNDMRTTNQKDYELAKEEGYEGNFQQWLTDMTRAGATNITIGEKVATKRALGEVASELSVESPDFAAEIEESYPLDDVEYDFHEDVQKLMDNYKLDRGEAANQVRKALVRRDMDRRIRQAYRKQNVDRRADGWYVNGKLTVRDPYDSK